MMRNMESGAKLFDAGGKPGIPPTTTADATKCDRFVILQVGEREFKTFRDTLIDESDYFASRLSKRWNDTEDDGSFFIDRDPELFEHILRYLRSLNFPLFFDFNTLDVDNGKYLALLGEARYFGVRKLEQWLASKQYLKAVKVETSTTITTSNQDTAVPKAINYGNVKVETSVGWGTKKVYVCPRSIHIHRGEPKKCGKDCNRVRAQQGEGFMYEDEAVPTIITIITTVTVDATICMPEESIGDGSYVSGGSTPEVC